MTWVLAWWDVWNSADVLVQWVRLCLSWMQPHELLTNRTPHAPCDRQTSMCMHMCLCTPSLGLLPVHEEGLHIDAFQTIFCETVQWCQWLQQSAQGTCPLSPRSTVCALPLLGSAWSGNFTFFSYCAQRACQDWAASLVWSKQISILFLDVGAQNQKEIFNMWSS